MWGVEFKLCFCHVLKGVLFSFFKGALSIVVVLIKEFNDGTVLSDFICVFVYVCVSACVINSILFFWNRLLVLVFVFQNCN